MNSSIFFRNFTQIDCGYVDDKGLVHGQSFNVSATISGKVTDDESVVLDFSKGKKLMKSIIDDNEYGFDHKLLLFKDSNYDLILNNDTFSVNSPYLFLSGPCNAMKKCCCNYKDLNDLIANHLEVELGKEGLEVYVTVQLSSIGFDKSGTYFNYFHSLKNSSSFGCKAFHGHRSFVEVENDFVLQDEIANKMNDNIFIFKENVVEEDPRGEYIKMTYNCSRGKFVGIFYKPHNWIVYDTETTIEFLIEHIKNNFFNRLEGKTLRVSEGLAKGAEIKC